jgi:hypothetical protein
MAVTLLLVAVFLWIILAVVPTFLRERREDEARRAQWASRSADEERKRK